MGLGPTSFVKPLLVPVAVGTGFVGYGCGLPVTIPIPNAVWPVYPQHPTISPVVIQSALDHCENC